MSIEQIRGEINKKPNDGLLYYYLAKKLFSRSLNDIDTLEEVKNDLNKAIKLAPNLYMAHFLLGRIHLLMKNNSGAEEEFRKAMAIKPDSLLAKEYIGKCLSIHDPVDMNKKSIRDTFYLLENEIRRFIEMRLKNELKENWLRDGVPQRIRGEWAKRREEGLEEENSLSLLHFADFHDYRGIMENNKVFFASYLNIKKWQERLGELEPIRNALAHSRPIPKEAEKKVKDYYTEFMNISGLVK